MKRKIAILTGGAWGSALAIPFADKGNTVSIFVRSEKKAQSFEKIHKLAVHKKIIFPENVSVTSDSSACLQDADILVLAVPSQHLRSFFGSISDQIPKKTIILIATKGLEEKTHFRMTEVVMQEEAVSHPIGVISGPNLAREVVLRNYTATVVASEDSGVLESVTDALHSSIFRIYGQYDALGVEMGGALKNVIAIAIGIGKGLGVKHNALAGLATRGLAEMRRMAVALGADPETLIGLSGMGDLILSFEAKTRNYLAGIEIGQGVDPEELLNSGETLEGLRTSKAAYELSQKMGIEVPIISLVYKIVYQNLDPSEALKALVARQPSIEERFAKANP